MCCRRCSLLYRAPSAPHRRSPRRCRPRFSARDPSDPNLGPRGTHGPLALRGAGSAPADGAQHPPGGRRRPCPRPPGPRRGEGRGGSRPRPRTPRSPHFLCVSGARQRGRAALPRDRRPPRWGKPRAAQTAEKRGVRKKIYILNNNKIKRCRRDPQDLPVIPGSEGRERPGSPSLKKGAKCK